MKKLFEIPVYALDGKTLNQRVETRIKTIEENAPGADREMLNRLVERETFPMRNWGYNHIIGYIQIGLTKQEIVVLVFMPVPAPSRYYWYSDKKYFTQDICANSAHVYIGNMETNEEMQTVAIELLERVIKDHLHGRFYADKTAFDAVNAHLDYLGLLEEM